MIGEQDQFDDPGLKAALKRTVGRETAPAGLRERVLRAMAEEGAKGSGVSGEGSGKAETASPIRLAGGGGEESRRRWYIGRSAGFRYAAAAIVLLAVGVGVWEWGPWRAKQNTTYVFKLRPQLLDAMVEAHDAEVASADHTTAGVPQNNFTAMAERLKQDVGHSVLAADLGKDGWKFEGASEDTIAGQKASHLLFARGKDTLSLVSLPGSLVTAANEGAWYQHGWKGHAVVGFKKSGGLHCLIATSPDREIKPEELAALLHSIEGDVKAEGPRHVGEVLAMLMPTGD
jgi:hypothetical protein